MNMKEIGEIRRRIRRDRTNITKLYGCYVNSQKEIVSRFVKSVGPMTENEANEYFGKLKKVLSGGLGKNMLDLPFKTSQVADSPEHKLLMNLRNHESMDETAVDELYRKIIENVKLDDGYLILLGCDSYDVPFKSSDGDSQADNSDEVFTYVLCAICPVKLTKTMLQYNPEEKYFTSGGAVNAAAAPEYGFMFPCFDGRSTNIYNVLFYTHSPKSDNQELVDALFHLQAPMSAHQQKTSFEHLLGSCLDKECSMEVVQAVHDQVCQSIELHKESKVAEPLLLDKELVKDVLMECGVSEQAVSKFSVEYDATFGMDAMLHPKNIVNSNKIEVTTPDVSIKVNPQRSDLIETRIIGGIPYILICADENVEVNGVSIKIENKE